MDPFLGQIKLFAGTFAPTGWALCNGQTINISDNDALYNLLGTSFGGDGVTTFAVPDLRSRVPLGIGSDGTGNTYAIGNTGGLEQVPLTDDHVIPHSHDFKCSLTIDKAKTNNAPKGNVLGTPPGKLFRAANPTGHLAPGSISTSQGDPHDNIQPYLAINYIIALAGVYPPQS